MLLKHGNSPPKLILPTYQKLLIILSASIQDDERGKMNVGLKLSAFVLSNTTGENNGDKFLC